MVSKITLNLLLDEHSMYPISYLTEQINKEKIGVTKTPILSLIQHSYYKSSKTIIICQTPLWADKEKRPVRSREVP